MSGTDAPRWQLAEVGKVVPNWQGPRVEGGQFEINANGAHLLHYYRDPTQREIRGAKTGNSRFALVPAGRHTLFMLYSIDLLTDGWSDAPFALGLVDPERRRLPERAENQGYLLMNMLIDADRGTLHALRGISLTPEFCLALDKLVSAQQLALVDFTPALHDAELKKAYSRWPKVSDMVSAAVALTRGGLDFPSESSP